MTEFLVGLIVAGVVGSGIYLNARERRERVAGWREAAAAAGLQHIHSWAGLAPGVGGSAGPLRVRLESYRADKYTTGTRVTIEGIASIRLRRESLMTAFEKVVGAREIEVGDEAFDREIYVEGAPELVRALLRPSTRPVLRELLQGRVQVGPRDVIEAAVRIHGGVLEADLPGRDHDVVRRLLPPLVKALVAVAERLVCPDDPAPRIAKNLRREPEWRARLGAVQLLADLYPHHPATTEALTHACRDENEEVQFHAARRLGEAQGRATLRELVRRGSADDAVLARAVQDLLGHLPVEEATAALDHALRTGRTETAKACVDALAGFGGPGVIDTLAKVLAVDGAGEQVQVVAARALGSTEDPGAEKPLLEALAAGTPPLRLAAAQALGFVGSTAAVLPLQEVGAAGGFEPGLKRAVREAVARIQSRALGATPGQLSLAESDAGQLSLADDDDPRGRVSTSGFSSGFGEEP